MPSEANRTTQRSTTHPTWLSSTADTTVKCLQLNSSSEAEFVLYYTLESMLDPDIRGDSALLHSLTMYHWWDHNITKPVWLFDTQNMRVVSSQPIDPFCFHSRQRNIHRSKWTSPALCLHTLAWRKKHTYNITAVSCCATPVQNLMTGMGV